MNKQVTAFFSIFLHPKRTMQELPSNKIYALGILSPLYFGMARAFRPRNHAVLYKELGGNLQIILLVLVIAIFMIPLGAWIMRQFLKLFKKRLSVRKILNINGYAQIPRLIVAVLGYVVMICEPSVFTLDTPSPILIILIILGLLAVFYSLFLMIFGFVVSPSEDKMASLNSLDSTGENKTNMVPELNEN